MEPELWNPLVEALFSGSISVHLSSEQAGSKNVMFRDLEGQGHEWQTWRYALYDFAPRLFQQPSGK